MSESAADEAADEGQEDLVGGSASNQAPPGAEDPPALPGGASGVQPRFAEAVSLGRAARTVFLRALILGSLIAVAFCTVVLLGPNPLDAEAAITGAVLGAAAGLFAIGVPSGVECWLATWSEVRRLRGALLLYLSALLGWLAGGVQFGYLHYVREGRELSEALVMSVEGALEASPPLLLFHLLLPAALAAASLRRLRWVVPDSKGPWRWVYLGLAVALLAATQVPGPYSGLLHVPLVAAALAVVLTLAYMVVHAIQVSLRPGDAEAGGEFVSSVEVAPDSPPTLWERVLMGGDSSMVLGSVAWLALGVLWARLGGQLVVVILCTLGCWFLHLILASNLPAIALGRGKPERALALARFFLRSRTKGRLAAQARMVRLYRETEVRALLALGRNEEAVRYLPEALGEVIEGLPDVLARVRLGTALVGAGLPKLCLEVVAPIPRDEQTRVGSELHAASLEAIALNTLDRPQEAYELTLPLLEHPAAVQKSVRAVLLNNLAVYQARLGLELDVARERAEEAGRLLPKLPQVRSTLGAVLQEQGKAEAARPLLEQGLESTVTPQSRAWVSELLGRCYRDLGEVELSQGAFARAVEAAPETEPGRAAAAALAASDDGGTPGEPLPQVAT